MRIVRVVAFVILVGVGLLYGLAARDGFQGFKPALDAYDRIAAHVRPDGVLEVSEELSLDASHLEDRTVERVLPYSQVTAVTVTDGKGSLLAMTLSDTGSDTRIEFTAPDGGHQRFVIGYQLGGRIRSSADVAEVRVRWFGRQSELPLEGLVVELNWPEAAGSALLASGVVRPEGPFAQRRSVLPVATGRIVWDASRVPAGAEADFRAGIPVAAVPDVAGPTGSMLGAIRSNEDRLADEAGSSRAVQVGLSATAVLLAAGLLVAWGGLQHRLGREYPVDHPAIERELPSDHPPAEVGWLLRFGQVLPQDVLATVLDLSRRGHVEILDRDGGTVLMATPVRGQRDRLRGFERDVLDWLFPEATTEVPFSERAVDIYRAQIDVRSEPGRAGSGDDRHGFGRLFRSFAADVEAAGQADGLMERKAGAALIIALRFAGLGAVALGAIFMGLGALAAPALIVAGALATAFAGALTRRTRHGAALAARWQAFARFLHDYSLLSEAPPGAVVLWEHYLAYAVSLGEAPTVVRLMSRFPPREGWKALVEQISAGVRSATAAGQD